MTGRICVARIGAAHGVRGEVKLWPFTQDPLAVATYGPLETEDGTRSFKVESLRPAKDHLVARFAGIGDRNAAEALRNLDLFVPRERLPPIAEPDTFYHADLVGLDARLSDGKVFGRVTAVRNFGAGDALEIALPAGGDVLVPFTRRTVPEVNVAAGYLTLDPPVGLFDGGEHEK